MSLFLNQGLIGFGAGGGIPRESLKTTVDNIGQTPRIIYDFADSDCYPGTGQTISDLTATGIDMHLGDDSGADTDDPTFVGVAGQFDAGTYFSHDGGDYFQINAADPAWVDDVHKSTIGIFTGIVIVKFVQSAGRQSFWSTNGQFSSTDRVGFSLMIEAPDNKLSFMVGSSGGEADVEYFVADDSVPAGPAMLAWVSDNQAGSGFFYRNGSYMQDAGADTFATAYATHTAALPSTNHLSLGASGRTSGPTAIVANTTKIYSALFDDTAWTKAELDLVWARVSGWLLATA